MTQIFLIRETGEGKLVVRIGCERFIPLGAKRIDVVRSLPGSKCYRESLVTGLISRITFRIWAAVYGFVKRLLVQIVIGSRMGGWRRTKTGAKVW